MWCVWYLSALLPHRWAHACWVSLPNAGHNLAARFLGEACQHTVGLSSLGGGEIGTCNTAAVQYSSTLSHLAQTGCSDRLRIKRLVHLCDGGTQVPFDDADRLCAVKGWDIVLQADASQIGLFSAIDMGSLTDVEVRQEAPANGWDGPHAALDMSSNCGQPFNQHARCPTPSECLHRAADHKMPFARQSLAELLQTKCRPLTCSFSSSPMNSGLRTSTLVLNCRRRRHQVITGALILSGKGTSQQQPVPQQHRHIGHQR